MDQPTEGSVFLRRTTNRRKRPYSIWFSIHFMNFHDRKRMCKAIITQMIAKRTFRFRFVRVNFTRYYEISIVAYTESIDIAIVKTTSCEQTGKGHLTHTFWQRHHGRQGMRRGATNKNTHL